MGAICILSFAVVVEFKWVVPSTVKVSLGVKVLIPTFPSFKIDIDKFVSLLPIPKLEVPTECVFYPILQFVPELLFDS